MSTEKLKALKVVELKQILSTANVSAPAKANKNDLIAKIQGSKEALDTYAKLYPAEDLLAPPEEVDWNAEQAEPIAEPAAPAPAAVAPAVASKPEQQVPQDGASGPASQSTADEEAEKRRKRAERFGIPVVEPKAPKAKAAPAKGNAVASSEQLQARAARFGLPTVTDKSASTPNNKKRGKAETEVDPEELERRRKRAERFAT